jgi:hypothetical protein
MSTPPLLLLGAIPISAFDGWAADLSVVGTGVALTVLWLRCASLAIGADSRYLVVRNITRTIMLDHTLRPIVISEGRPLAVALISGGLGETSIRLEVPGRARIYVSVTRGKAMRPPAQLQAVLGRIRN